jgi:hypothetical protein
MHCIYRLLKYYYIDTFAKRGKYSMGDYMCKLMLHEQIRGTCRLHHLSYITEEVYLLWVKDSFYCIINVNQKRWKKNILV